MWDRQKGFHNFWGRANDFLFFTKLTLPEPMTFGDGCVAADGVVLIRHPDEDDNVKGGRTVIEEFRHNSFHP